MIALKDITADNIKTVSAYLEREDRAFGDFTAAYSWPLQGLEHFQYAESEGCLIWREGKDELPTFSLPIGGADTKAAMDIIRDYCKSNSIKLIWGPLTNGQASDLEAAEPDKLFIPVFLPQFWPDYICERKALETMAGTHLSGKRWFVHKFEQLGTSSYEPFRQDHALDVLEEWMEEKSCLGESESVRTEYNGCKAYIMHEPQSIKGGILYLNGKAVGFNIGEAISSDTIVLSYQKALRDVKGAYAALVRNFARNEAKSYKYINLADTQGNLSLRHAKLEYHPLPLQSKLALFETDRKLKDQLSVREARPEDAMFLAHCTLAAQGQFDFVSPADRAEEMTEICSKEEGAQSYRNSRVVTAFDIPVACTVRTETDGTEAIVTLPSLRGNGLEDLLK